MADTIPPDTTMPARYWLLIDRGPPLGPFSIGEIIERHGSANFATARICPVGGTDWGFLKDHPEFADLPVLMQLDAEQTAITGSAKPAPRTSGSVPRPSANSEPSPPAVWAAAAIGVLIIAGVAWLIYEWARPLTPLEVVERFDKCKSAEEAKALCTRNFHPALVTLFLLDDDPNPNQNSATSMFDEGGSNLFHTVRIDLSQYDKAQRRRVAASMRVNLVKSDGWKIDDVSFVSYDGQTLPEPFSIGKNYLMILQDLQQNRPVRPPGAPAPEQSKPKSDETKTKQTIAFLLWKFLASGGAKVVGVVVIAVGGAIYAAVRSRGSGLKK